jgi:hypothetical protein
MTLVEYRTLAQEVYLLRAEVAAMRFELRSLVELLTAPRDVAATSPRQGPQLGGHPDEMVDSAYVARLFGCAVSSVRAGKAGTHHVK